MGGVGAGTVTRGVGWARARVRVRASDTARERGDPPGPPDSRGRTRAEANDMRAQLAHLNSSHAGAQLEMRSLEQKQVAGEALAALGLRVSLGSRLGTSA